MREIYSPSYVCPCQFPYYVNMPIDNYETPSTFGTYPNEPMWDHATFGTYPNEPMWDHATSGTYPNEPMWDHATFGTYPNEPMWDNAAFGTFPHDPMWDDAAFGSFQGDDPITLRDYGPAPFSININEASKQNNNYRTVLWTGPHLQVALMSINVGDDIGLEVHPDNDQFLRIEQGQGTVQMGKSKDQLNYVRNVGDDSAIMVPAGTWHNVTNTGNIPLKLYTIYAPPHHPFGTVHETKEIAMAAEEGH